MKKMIVVITLCLFTSLVISSAFAAEANAPQAPAEKPHRVVAEGTVNVVKDANGNLTEVILQTATIKYNVTLNEKGKELGALDGKKVKVSGTIRTEGGAEWLTVHRFEEVPAELPKEAPKEAPK
jgi:hypothetical protein